MQIAVIVPRYGVNVSGGAEHLARGFAEEAAARGWQVEVWTTCSRNHYTWKNTLPAGQSELNGVLVRRFPITSFLSEEFRKFETKTVTHGRLSLTEQYQWMEVGAHSSHLYSHILQHGNKFDAIVALPYVHPLIHYAAWLIPQKIFLWPCLHEEPFAYMEPVRLLLETVHSVLFNSPEEQLLAFERLMIRPQRATLLGAGVELSEPSDVPPNIQKPYIVYVGRMEEDKNLRLLYRYVERNAQENEMVRLLLLGEGPLIPAENDLFKYHGFASETEKSMICANALALCQPSLNESFSLVIMESWLAGRPVLVSGACEVTRGHVRRA